MFLHSGCSYCNLNSSILHSLYIILVFGSSPQLSPFNYHYNFGTPDESDFLKGLIYITFFQEKCILNFIFDTCTAKKCSTRGNLFAASVWLKKPKISPPEGNGRESQNVVTWGERERENAVNKGRYFMPAAHTTRSVQMTMYMWWNIPCLTTMTVSSFLFGNTKYLIK